MWPAGAGTKLPCPRDSALRRAAFSGNLTALPSHLVPAGRSVRVFISANPEGKSLDPVCPWVDPRIGEGTKVRGASQPGALYAPCLPAAARSAWEFHSNHLFFFNSSASLLTSRTHLSSPSQIKR